MSLSLKTALAAALETAINSALVYDPATRQRLEAIHDTLCLRFTLPDISLYLLVSDQRVRVLAHCEDPVATCLTGSPLALLTLLNRPVSLANSGVQLVGSTGLLQEWQAVLDQLDIDWQAAMDQVLGEQLSDYVTPYLAKALSGGVAYGKAQAEEQGRLLREFIEHELQLVPTPGEVDFFYGQVRELAMDTDRLEARLQLLEKQILKKKGIKAGEPPRV